MTAGSARRMDPDALASLEEERRFLLRSLSDLDSELAAGDIDQSDYEELKDDYTRRAAVVIRAIDNQRAAAQPKGGVRWQQAVVWLVGLALLGGISGVLIARSSGTRGSGDTITGGVRTSVVTRLNQARALLGDQTAWDEAIDIYESIIVEQPSNAEALTYKAWLEYRGGEPVAGVLASLEEVHGLAPDYADAVVFSVIVLTDAGRHDEAAVVLRRLDATETSDATVALIEQRGLVGEVYGESTYVLLSSTTAPTLDDLGLSSDEALSAAGYLLATDKELRSVAALKLYQAVNAADPLNTAALSREAMLLALTLDPGLVASALELADRAVESSPDDPEALLTRATVLSIAEVDQETMCADLRRVLVMQDVSGEITARAETLASSCP